jgi:hypothetical protein
MSTGMPAIAGGSAGTPDAAQAGSDKSANNGAKPAQIEELRCALRDRGKSIRGIGTFDRRI